MTKNIIYAAFASLLLTPLVAVSQDEETDSDEAVFDPMEQTVPVADENILPAPMLEETPNEASEERLLEEFSRYRRLLQEGTLDEADIALKHDGLSCRRHAS